MQNQDALQGAAWVEWRSHPQTKEFLRLLNQQFEATERQWSNREFTADSIEQSALPNARALGTQQALAQIITAIENIVPETGVIV